MGKVKVNTWAIYNDQTAEVTPNGGLAWFSEGIPEKNGLKSG